MRLSRAVGAAALALATSIGALGAVPTNASAAPAPGGEAVLAAEPGVFPPELILLHAGKGMLLKDRKNREPISWRHADGRKTPLDCGGGIVTFGDEIGCIGTTDLKIRNFDTGAAESVPAKDNRTWANAMSPNQVLTYEKDANSRYVLHLLGRVNEPRKDVPVTGAGPMGSFAVLASDGSGALLEYWNTAEEGGHGHRYLDYGTATLTELPRPSGVGSAYSKASLGSRWIAMVQFDEAIMVSRTDPSVTRTMSVPGPDRVMPVGDWLIADMRRSSGDTSVWAYPVAGGTPRPVLNGLDGPLLLGPDGGAYGLSTPFGSGRWGINGISVDAQGAPRVQEALPLPPQPSDRRSIAFAQGDLSALHLDRTESVLGYRVSVKEPLSVAQAPYWRCDTSRADPSCQHAASTRSGNAATGDGRVVGITAESTSCTEGCEYTAYVRDARTGGAHRTVKLPGALQWARMLSASGRHVLIRVQEKGTERLVVLDIDSGKPLDIKPASTAGLWGSLLWQPEGDKGVVAATDLRTGQVTRRVDLGSGCRPYELQANGDWFYWTCSAEGAGAAAYHVPSRKRIPVSFAEKPHGAVELGDGYLAHEGHGRLHVYNLRTGTAVMEHRVDEFAAGGPSIGFAVDRFGGRLAYLAQDETVHIVGVTGSTSPLSVIDKNVPGTLDSKSTTGRQARWWLSKPASSWKLLVRNPASGISTVVRTGGEARGVIDLTWDGKDQSGRTVANGSYEWTLLVSPADGKGGQHSTTGSVILSGATSQAGRPTRP
ncbi:FlgD immunoglobulin-like domain containing protein [Streptomyces erythrochromogenes]|uniref:FlgD immunoglobulin-like domain containing protein n=1 Tax=Streptomyces erythrochromogenes TaxID=285574 RepID=UPI00364104B5